MEVKLVSRERGVQSVLTRGQTRDAACGHVTEVKLVNRERHVHLKCLGASARVYRSF